MKLFELMKKCEETSDLFHLQSLQHEHLYAQDVQKSQTFDIEAMDGRDGLNGLR